jgi:hypothetical protein
MVLQRVTDFKDVLGWDQSQIRSFEGICRHTALAALAQLRDVAIRGALHGKITLSPAHGGEHAAPGKSGPGADDACAGEADLVIPLGDVPVPARGGQPCPRGICLIKLSVAETARLTRLASQYTSGLINRARLAFTLHCPPAEGGTRPPPADTTTAPASRP